MALDCSTVYKNTGVTECIEQVGYFYKAVPVPDNFEIADIATAITEATWTTYFQADIPGRAYPFPAFKKINSVTQNEPVYEALIAGQQDLVREGTDVIDMGLDTVALCVYKNLRSFNKKKNIKVVIVDSNGYIWASTPDGEKIKGIDTNIFYVKKRTIPDGETLVRGGLVIEFKDVEQFNDDLILIKPTDFDPRDWEGLRDVTLSESSASETSITISAKICGNTAVDVFEETDFNVVDSAGDTVTIGTFTNNGDGTYQFDGTFTAGDYTFNLNAPSAMTTLGFESSGSLTVTTSA